MAGEWRTQIPPEVECREKLSRLQAALDDLSPHWIRLNGPVPDGKEGEAGAFYCVSHMNASIAEFLLYTWEDGEWVDDAGDPPSRYWTPLAYLPLRREHVEAVLGPEVRR